MSEEGPQNPVSKGIQTFHPTSEEFQNFSRYIAYMEFQGAHKAGLAKIVPPKDWKPRGSYDDIDELVIPAPIQQVVTGQSGLFTQFNMQKKAMTVQEFRKMANSDKFSTPLYADFEELERKYWKNVTFNPPIYGADVNGTLYDPSVTEWNIGHLNTILDTVEHESGITIEGVNTPYLYFGMWKTTFAWHTEDMDLYSINYLHFGEPKSWYCVPPEHGKRLERLAHGFFAGSAQNCEAFLRHKMTLISPSILRKYGIPFEKITQEAGEFMVTFPYSYHAGFNHGFNCAESTNFATERWIEYGKKATLCSCRKDMVKISMDVFVKKYQPDRYERWLAGRDTGPIDHSRPTPEAKEFLGEELGSISSSSQGPCVEELNTDGERKSPTQRIGAKRHRVCLEVPDTVVFGDDKKEEEEEEEEYRKKARLSTGSEDCSGDGDPPKLVITPSKLFLREPPSVKTDPGSGTPLPPQEATISSTTTPASSILAQAQQSLRNGHVTVAALPNRTGATTQSARPTLKLGVASLLFHKTLSPKEALQVHSYARENQQHQHHTQLHVHSYAREHQPRLHLQHQAQHKAQAQAQAQAQTQATGHGRTEQGECHSLPTKGEQHNQAKAYTKGQQQQAKAQSQSLSQGQQEQPGKAQAQEESPEAKVLNRLEPVQTQAQTWAGKRVEVEEEALRTDKWKQTFPSTTHGKQTVQGTTYCKSLKSKQKTELCKLPRQHPLLRECSSDDELYLDIEDEPEKTDKWARPLAQLWQSRPYNPDAEREYNKHMGSQAPYCAVCLLFHTYYQLESGSGSPGQTLVGRRGGRQKSKPLIPEMCFSTTTKKGLSTEEKGHLTTPHLEEDGTSTLVSCSQCCVRVHTSCYGVSGDEVSDEWKCARCEANAMTEDCCLCPLRGGALQRANNDKWVHVLCAVTILEARFMDIIDRSPVDLSGIPLQRFKLKCHLCRQRIRREMTGCCVQCSHGRCSTAFHPTCAQAAGVLLHPDDWPFIVHVTCSKHKASTIPERDTASMRELEVGQKVICKYRNGRYYHCEVVELTTATFYEVIFDDGSFSDNLFPEDIENRDCVQLGPPSEGDVVQVRWTDGLLYGAKFVASHSIPMYQVEFEDGSQLSAKREDVYSLDEDLPKRVKSRMSVASDMRFDGIFTEKEVKQDSKRQRVINSRYREDYIEPVIYRAIME